MVKNRKKRAERAKIYVKKMKQLFRHFRDPIDITMQKY